MSRVWSHAALRRRLRPGASPVATRPLCSALRPWPARALRYALRGSDLGRSPAARPAAAQRPSGGCPSLAAQRPSGVRPSLAQLAVARQAARGAAPLPAGRWPNQAGSGEQEDRSRALVCIWFPNFKFSTLCCSLYFEKFLFQLHSKITV